MGNELMFLITLLYNDEQVLRVVLKIPKDNVSLHTAEYPMEPDSKQELMSWLDEDLQQCGKIIEVDKQTIFDVVVIADTES